MNNEDLWQNLGDAYYLTSNYGQASYYLGLRIASGQPFPSVRQEIDIRLKLARSLKQNQRFLESKSILSSIDKILIETKIEEFKIETILP